MIAVATVLTACGIETGERICCLLGNLSELQQCLPLAVLKLAYFCFKAMLLVSCNSAYRLRY